MKKIIAALLILAFGLTLEASAVNLYSLFKDKPEIKIHLKKVTSEVSAPHVKNSVFKDVFRKVLPERVNTRFRWANNARSGDCVVTAKIKKYVFTKKAMPSLMGRFSLIADLLAPKSAARLVVDYTITNPDGTKILAEFRDFTINARRPRKDMVGKKAFMHAANKSINRFLHRAFDPQTNRHKDLSGQ